MENTHGEVLFLVKLQLNCTNSIKSHKASNITLTGLYALGKLTLNGISESSFVDHPFNMCGKFLDPFRSRHSQMFFKVGVLKNLAIFKGKHLFLSRFLIKLQTLLKRDSNTNRCFPVNVAKFLRRPFITEHLWWLLLSFVCDHVLFEKNGTFHRNKAPL